MLVLAEEYRVRLRSANMLELLIEEVRRREAVIRIFPNDRSAWRLCGALRPTSTLRNIIARSCSRSNKRGDGANHATQA